MMFLFSNALLNSNPSLPGSSANLLTTSKPFFGFFIIVSLALFESPASVTFVFDWFTVAVLPVLSIGV